MSNIKFISYEEFPEDQYTKAIVYLQFEAKHPYQVCYVRKEAKNGGVYWGVPKVSVTKKGEKAYFESYLQDSLFMDKEIKAFLDSKPWLTQPNYTTSAPIEEELPF